MPANNLYPRWYLTFSGFVWGLVCGVAVVTCLYETKTWTVDNFWRQQLLPWLIPLVPMAILSLFEIFFHIRHHLRLRRDPQRSADAC